MMSFCWHRRIFKPCWVSAAFFNYHAKVHGVRVADGPLLVWWNFFLVFDGQDIVDVVLSFASGAANAAAEAAASARISACS